MFEDKNCAWHFRAFVPNVDELRGANDPIIQKFKDNFYNSLVRESIQNSMDAKGDSTFIEVKYELGVVKRSDYPALFDLRKHIAACKETHGDNNRAQEIYGPMADFINTEELDVLTISDSRTEGMPYLPDNIYKNPFSAFVNSEGQSVKTTTNSDGATVSNGGSFGIGKGAYFLMSPVRSLLVSTMVNDTEKHTFFEGVSRLCTHDIDDTHYYHMGFYCIDGETPVMGDEIPTQFKRDRPGTSISLIGLHEDLGSKQNVEDEIEKAVISNFWLAIYNEKLIVTVGQRKPIDRDSLEDKMRAMFINEYAKGNPILYYKAYTTPPDNRRFFKFVKTDDEYLGHCELYIRVGETGKKDMITCMRDMMMLIQTIPSPRQHHAGISGTFLCLGEPGNANFELTEDESHSSWSAKGKSGDAKKRATTLIHRMEDFMKESIDSIIGMDGDKIDVTIDAINDTNISDIVAEEGKGGNPFGTVRDSNNHIKDGFDRFSIPVSFKEKAETSGKDQGTIISGPTSGSKDGGTENIAFGPHSFNKIKPRNKHPKPGPRTKPKDVVSDNGAKEYKIIPTYFDVAAHLEKGEWVHTIYMEIDDDTSLYEKLYVDIAVGLDNTQEDAKVDLKSAKMQGEKITVDHSRVLFNKIDGNSITLDIVFKDNIRHAVKLG